MKNIRNMKNTSDPQDVDHKPEPLILITTICAVVAICMMLLSCSTLSMADEVAPATDKAATKELIGVMGLPPVTPTADDEAATNTASDADASRTDEADEADEAVGVNTTDSMPLTTDLQQHINKLASENGIDRCIIYAMIKHESGYKADAIGDNGNSIGLMQVQPRYHKARMARLGVTDLVDPYQNVLVGIDYLAEMLERYEGSIAKALTAYNCGIGGAEKYFSQGIDANTYTKKILAYAKELKEGVAA